MYSNSNLVKVAVLLDECFFILNKHGVCMRKTG